MTSKMCSCDDSRDVSKGCRFRTNWPNDLVPGRAQLKVGQMSEKWPKVDPNGPQKSYFLEFLEPKLRLNVFADKFSIYEIFKIFPPVLEMKILTTISQ